MSEPCRHPAWAGSFYPESATELAHQIKSFPCGSSLPQGRLRGIILPHAGYTYSGYTAAQAQATIAKTQAKHIILLGPDHHVGMMANHVSTNATWQTPLGEIAISPLAKKLLQDAPTLFQSNPLSEAKEHSLEVLVPYLQSWLEDFDLLPIVTCQTNPKELAVALAPHIHDDSLLVISSDLSHFLSDDEARLKDHETIAAILDLNLDHLRLNDNKACGLTGICALIHLAKQYAWQPHLLHYATSSETSGDRSRVVGYTSIGFYEDDQ